jgi:hypothetical protein
MEFSPALVHEYQVELATTYGVEVSFADSQVQLASLIRCLFGNAAGGACAGTTVRRRAAPEVGDSITPTSGHLDKIYG